MNNDRCEQGFLDLNKNYHFEDITYVLYSHEYTMYIMLFVGWEVRIVKNCDQGLENAA